MPRREVLVVDDDPEARDALAQLLEAHGYEVRQAPNGRVALDLLAERLPAVMILDLEMPEMTGWEVLESLERSGAVHAIRVIVVSAAAAAAAPQGVAFMRKPCCVDELFGLVAGTAVEGAGARLPQRAS
jgi:CheY-like chemotaxis protein